MIVNNENRLNLKSNMLDILFKLLLRLPLKTYKLISIYNYFYRVYLIFKQKLKTK